MQTLWNNGYRGPSNQIFSMLFDDDDTIAGLADHSVLPEQFYGPPRKAYPESGEIALVRAVLIDAISCFQRPSVGTRRDQRLVKEAEEWFFSNKDSQPFSFLNICSVLGLEPEYIRLGLRRWQRCQTATGTRARKTRHIVRTPQLKRAA